MENPDENIFFVLQNFQKLTPEEQVNLYLDTV